MLNIIASNPLPFVIALLIGIAVAWWTWGRRPSGEVSVDSSGEESLGETHVAEPDQPADPVPPIAAGSAAGAAAVAAVLPGSDSDDAAANDTDGESEPRPRIAQAVGDPDDLERVRGIGPKLNRLLASLGVLRFDQIAAWNDGDIAEVDSHLGAFKGRIDRDNWVEQAKLLADGRDEDFERRFGGRKR